eukprot:m.290185 g.290185  ORF g.290185 m.290185 type:complete len:52 (-) comp55072_c0_seq3:1955-2110(-)
MRTLDLGCCHHPDPLLHTTKPMQLNQTQQTTHQTHQFKTEVEEPNASQPPR